MSFKYYSLTPPKITRKFPKLTVECPLREGGVFPEINNWLMVCVYGSNITTSPNTFWVLLSLPP